MIAIIAAAVAVVVVLAAGGWFLLNQDGPGDDGGNKKHGPLANSDAKPSSTKSKQLFKTPSPHVSGSGPLELPSGWATDKIFAKPTANGVQGVNAASGKKAWKIPLDGKVCATSKQVTSSGKVAVAFAETVSPEAKCTKIAVLDLTKGKKDWQATVPDSQDNLGSGTELAISRGVVMVRLDESEAAYPLSGRKPLWHQKMDSFSEKCTDDGIAGGKQMLAIRKCGDDHDPQMAVQRINPKSGKKKWEFKAPSGVKEIHVINVSPLVIAVSTEPGKTTDVMTVGKDHRLRGEISLGDREFDPGCEEGTESCANAAADSKHVYLPTKSHSGGQAIGLTNEIMAFDFNSGEQSWKVDAGDGREIKPIRMAGSKLLAYRMPTYDKGGEVTAIDPARQGKEQLYMRNSDSTAEQEDDLASITSREPVVYANGRLFLQKNLISGHGTFDKYTSMGFGPK